jgi:hypothetical protein
MDNGKFYLKKFLGRNRRAAYPGGNTNYRLHRLWRPRTQHACAENGFQNQADILLPHRLHA